MRIRVDITTSASELPWPEVHGPARAVLYDLIRSRNAEMAEELHDAGWRGSPLRPVGMSPPLFLGAPRIAGAYAVSPRGTISMGSPVPGIASSLLSALAHRDRLRWGSTMLTIVGVQSDEIPDYKSGTAVFETVSPILVKDRDYYLLPGDAYYSELLKHNIRHKADVLGLPNEVEIEVLSSGPRRRFDTPKGFRIGATARIEVTCDPRLLAALYEWGLGQSTVEGFGWIK